MIRVKAGGRTKPARPLRWLAESATLISTLLTIEVELPTSGGTLRFRCPNAQTLRRAYTLFIKEPGTIAWLDQELRPGDVFLDVGANVGVYTLYAAQRVGPSGHVFAVEPHLRNAVALMDNVIANGFQEQISLLTVALCDAPGAARFDYREWRTGSSHSQLTVDGSGTKGIGELKLAQSIDALIGANTIRAPNLIKVDVDGIEPLIARGMARLLTGPDRPRSVQIECDPANREEIERFMAQSGYAMRVRHATMAGAKHVADGAQLTSLPHNVIFAPTV